MFGENVGYVAYVCDIEVSAVVEDRDEVVEGDFCDLEDGGDGNLSNCIKNVNEAADAEYVLNNRLAEYNLIAHPGNPIRLRQKLK